MQIAPNVFSVGVSNPTMRIFDIVMKTEYGTSYNAYIVKGTDKIALVEGSHLGFVESSTENVTEVCDIKKIDYLIVNHTEPDHSGSVRYLVENNPDIMIFGTAACIKNLDNIVRIPFNRTVVKDGDTIDLGGKSLVFAVAPNIHWPDTMVTYLPEDKILFSCDFLGAHFAEPTMYVHKAYRKDLYEQEFQNYFNAIMRPFSKFVVRALDRIKDFDIEMICPSHGPIMLKNEAEVAIAKYREWATPVAKDKKSVSVFYVSAYGYTRELAEYLTDKLNSKGLDVHTFDVIQHDAHELAEHLEADALVFGSPTINRAVLKPVIDLVSSIDAIEASGKPFATFGCFGWTGEACEQLNERCQSIKMKKICDSVRSQFAPTDEVFAQLDAMADQIAQTLA